MNDQKTLVDIADRGLAGLEKIAHEFGRIAPGLWQATVTHELVYAWAKVIVYVLVIVICLSLFFYSRKAHAKLVSTAFETQRENEKHSEYEQRVTERKDSLSWYDGIGVVSLIAIAISFICFIVDVPSAAATIAAPETTAAKTILREIQ